MAILDKPGPALRWVQVGHTIAIIPFTLFISFMDIFQVQLESGEIVGISARLGLVGDFLNVMLVCLLIAQVLSIWRISTISVIIYGWFGTWLALASIAALSASQVFDEELNNLTSGAQQVLNLLGVKYQISNIAISVGEAWIYLLICSITFIAMGVWIYIEKFRRLNNSRREAVTN